MVVGDHDVGAVVADGAKAVFIQRVPALPDGGGALAHLVEPGGAAVAQEHLVRAVGMAVVGQGEEDVGRAGEARADAPVLVLGQLAQAVGRGLLRGPVGEHADVQRQHVGGLELLQKPALAVGQNRDIGVGHPLGKGFVSRGVGLLAQDGGHLGENSGGVAQACRGRPLGAGLPLLHLRQIRRDPVAKVQGRGGVPQVAVLAEAAKPRPEGAGLDVALHGLIVLREHAAVASGPVFGPGHQHAGVAPPVDGHQGHGGGKAEALRGHHVGDAAAGPLLGAHVAQPLVEKAAHVKVEAGRRREDRDVARPAQALVALRAVGGDVHQVGLCAPEDVALQAVDHLVGAGKAAHGGKIGIQRDGGELDLLGLGALQADVAEAHVAHAGVIGLHAVFADIGGSGLGRAQKGAVQAAVGV